MEEIFSWWFLPISKFTGLLPVIPQGNGFKFSWFTAFRGSVTMLVVLAWLLYSIVPEFTEPMDTRDKCSIAIMMCFSVASAVITIVTIAKSKMGAFDKIASNLATFNTFWKNKSVVEPKYNDYVNSYFTYFLFGLEMVEIVARIYFDIERSLQITAFLVPIALIFLRSIILSLNVLQAEIVTKIAKNYRRINKITKFCCCNRGQKNELGEECLDANIIKDVPSVTVEEIRDMHLLLCNTVEEINSFFGIQNMFYFVANFFSIVVRPYFLIEVLIKSEKHKIKLPTSRFAFIQITQFIQAFLQVLLIAYVSSSTSRKAKRTAYHVSRLLSRNLTKDERREVKEALLQIVNSKAQIRVLNLFDVNMSLITSTVGMAMGVVILQLR